MMKTSSRTWTLTDATTGRFVEQLTVGPRDMPGLSGNWSVSKRRLRGGLSDGVDVIQVDTGTLQLTILPTRGMGIWRATAGDVRLGWDSPVRGPVHPQWVPLMEPGGLGWLDGFDEFVVRCGLESNGAPDFDASGHLRFPLHGRIANRPAHFVSVSVDGDSGDIVVTGIIEETRFHFQKLRLTTVLRTRLGETSFSLHDRIENFSGSPGHFQLLYHNNFGSPVLRKGSRIVAPMAEIAPNNTHSASRLESWDLFDAPQPGDGEQVFFMRMAADPQQRTRVVLTDAQGAIGAGLVYSVEQLPCFSLWKNMTSLEDGYVTGLEPGTNFPNPHSFEQAHGRVVELPSGGSRDFEITFEAYTDATAVRSAVDAVRQLAGDIEPVIHTSPYPEWCSV